MMKMEMNWWDTMVNPMRKVWLRVTKRIGFRKTGLLKLRKEVRTCEYQDVHILWDLLKRNEPDLARSGRWKLRWPKCSALLCRGF